MDWVRTHFLTCLVFFPLIWALPLLVPAFANKSIGNNKEGPGFSAWWALVGAAVTVVASACAVMAIPDFSSGFVLVERYGWIPALGIDYSVGADGISAWLLLLAAGLTALAVLGSFTSATGNRGAYYFLILALETTMLGAFVARDLFLFYVFWEAMLVPMCFLIGVWGGDRRIYAAVKFVLYTLTGSLLMLVAIFYLARLHREQTGTYSTGLEDLLGLAIPSAHGFVSAQSLLFAAFALSFAIKVPLFPLHTWLPDAHVQAPTAGSVILAGVLLKMGGYGFMRFAVPLFPDASRLYQPVMLGIGAVAVVYGAMMALAQSDIKKLVAYSSVSHMGFVVLGIFSLNHTGMAGAYYQMLAHGVSTGALFALVGMLYERTHTREISSYGGLATGMPRYSAAFMIIMLASVALPGTCGFVAEFLVLLGTWRASRLAGAVAGCGMILGAVYMLWMFQRVMFGKFSNTGERWTRDIDFRETILLAVFVVTAIVMGFVPDAVFSKADKPLAAVLVERGRSG
ncbi:MAG: hypothetical protein A2583_06625 [Bdellovibrionales bacterium RIFOXYD1_FULL_53_11]|nr:MAG: hypothetical protein A2583_06625 [Bdellovibrionales bacterium RIFOXYD1_FULL_53_11]